MAERFSVQKKIIMAGANAAAIEARKGISNERSQPIVSASLDAGTTSGKIVNQRRRNNENNIGISEPQNNGNDIVLRSLDLKEKEHLNERITFLRKEIQALELKAKQGEKVEDAEVISREEMVRTLEKKRKNISDQESAQKKKSSGKNAETSSKPQTQTGSDRGGRNNGGGRGSIPPDEPPIVPPSDNEGGLEDFVPQVGDMWVKTNADGTQSRIFVTALTEGMMDVRQGANAEELLSEPREEDEGDMTAHSLSIEALQEKLSTEGYVREAQGQKISSIPVVDSVSAEAWQKAEQEELERQKTEKKAENDRLASVRAGHEARLRELLDQEEEGSFDTVPTDEKEEPKEIKASETIKNEPIIELQTSEEKTLETDREAEQANIDSLRTMVGEMRARWVETDVKNRDAWKKFKSMFGIEQDARKDDAQVYYETAVKNLQNAEVALLQKRIDEEQLTPEERTKEIERIMRYYKLDESTNLINERTQYKSEHLKDASGIEKVTVLLGNLGRAYNRIPLTRKLAITAAFLGITAGIALSGGSGTAAGALAFASVIRKVASGAGMAVGTEALLESFGERKRVDQAEGEIAQEMERLKTESLGMKPEVTFDALNTLLDQDINALNTKLQNEKRAKTWRKVSALGVGGLVGSGWLTQVAMDHLGGNQAVDWVKDQIGNTPQASAQIPTPGEVSPLAIPSVPVPSEAPIEAPQVPQPDTDPLTGVFNQDYVVKPGDSVWKIAGGVADTLKLEGAEKTHFIDALKDKYGDVQLKAGETIKFSDHGIDKAFVENALSQAQSLSPDQIVSITANDAKIADYVASHPGTTLTNAKVDEILSGKIATQSVGENTPPLERVTESPVSNVVPVESPSVSREPVFTAELIPRVNDWYMQIFRMENPALGQDWIVDKKEMSSIKLMDIFKDAKLYKAGSFTGYKTGLNHEQIKNFTQFFQGVEDNKIAFDRIAFLREHPNVTVMDYLKKISTLVTPGQRLGLYTTTQ
ncbi:MAG: hypothetical protein PHH40_02975 [Candidatus Moranbacteria bacterium]|nr:hypothetical protein [Candidatus Moranbacteria bacterium]MDD3965150.1 hypothetical protein [Candidatus Moranbacteria bacterium]